MSVSFLISALVAALVIAVIAYIADFFLAKSGMGFPRQIIWLIAFVVWIVYVFGTGGGGLRP